MIKALSLFVFNVFINVSFGQTINAGADQDICDGECADLSATYTGGGVSTDYTVADITYAPNPYGVTTVSLTDDSQTGLLPIGFDFCFYGNTYSDFVICSNNWIGFSAGETSTWVTTAIPAVAGAPRNCIMGPWHDINPSVGGTISYDVDGVAPFRRLVVTYETVPMFSCGGLLFTSQIIIYETTNIIENHISSKPICATWNSGNAAQGIHNIDGTAAVVYPGRNNTAWDVTNHAVRYTPIGTPTIEWYEGVTLLGAGADITVCPATTTTYTAKLISCGSEVATDDVVVTVNPDPVIDAGIDQEVCEGETVILAGTGAGLGGTYAWDGGVTDGVAFTPPLGTTTYTVTGTDTNGCDGTDMVDVTVNPAPIVTASATPTEICEDETLVLTGGGADTYTWDGGATNGVAFTPPLGTTTYTVSGTDLTTGCENTATVDVTVNPLPAVTATADFTEVCEGDFVVLTGGGADTFTWDGGVTDSVAFAPPIGTTTYTVTGTDAATGCVDTATIDITSFDLPPVTATATPDEVCIGESITFTGGGADTYVWTDGIVNGVPFTPAAAGTFTYTVTGTLGIGCENRADVTVTVHDLPTVTATATPDAICAGETLVLNGGGADTYTWDGGATDGVAFEPPSGTTTYTVTGTDVNGCENTASIVVTVNPLPTVTATASDIEICLGESIVMTSGGTAATYDWDGGVTEGDPFTPLTPGDHTFTVTGTSAEGCVSSASVTVTVIECEEVVANFLYDSNICIGDCVSFRNSSIGTIVSWDWVFEGGDPSTSSLSNPIVCFNTEGDYSITLTVTNEYGLTSTITQPLMVHGVPSITAANDTIIDAGGTAILVATGGDADGVYIWTPDHRLDCQDCQITEARPDETTTYQVMYMSPYGCASSDTVLVLVNYAKRVGVPSEFSPNGDGNNDVLFVKGEGIVNMSFQLYNRYGEMIFQSDDQRIGWDGTYKGRLENPAVFTWVLHYTFEDGELGMLKGNTTLVR